jgi:ankyrin repeat protein
MNSEVDVTPQRTGQSEERNAEFRKRKNKTARISDAFGQKMADFSATFPIESARIGDEDSIVSWQKQNRGNINAPLEYETWTPLHLVTAEGNLTAVKLLLKLGARPDEITPTTIPG